MFGKKIFASCFTLLFCTGCAQTEIVYTISNAFDTSEAESLMVDGANHVRGHAQMNFNDGGTATCAGRHVFLIPATQYAKERMHAVFDGKEVAFYPGVGLSKDIRFEPDEPEYARLRKVVICDSAGNFEFTALADGEFIVGTTIYWSVHRSVHRAVFMRQIQLANGVNEKVEFTHQMYRQTYEPRPVKR